ncbi:MAG TPA: NeuD/PglB/VioB family sugar acetyltransferase [Candidatus Limnocylindria bacterium]|nr:NeuD/PglB/VioB family sugar acetyltransferase [Candidatus Limnocylindria bacterium]
MIQSAPRFLVLQSAQEQEWNGVLAQVARRDFYHLAEYHRLAEERGEGSAHLFAYHDGGYTIALPLLLRPVESAVGGTWSDATSVYGYAGPLASHAGIPASVVRSFQKGLKEALVARRVVAVFSRLHPLIPQRGMLAGLGDCRPEGETVSIDLTLSPEEQWARYRASLRTRIKKLRRGGLVCLRDRDKRHLPEFTDIYYETMRRVKAHSSYFFEKEYFTRLASGLGPALELFVVTLDGVVVAGGLFTICDGIVQYHLGGTCDAFLKLGPMALLFDTVRLWANEQGARVVHLGGGVGSREDSLFHFKAGFSDRRHVFPTWQWVVEPDAYRELCDRHALRNVGHGVQWTSADYFPQYRCSTTPMEKKDGIVVIGAGGHAKVLISTLIARGFSIEAVLDDDDSKWGMDVQGTRVSRIERERGGSGIIGIGDNAQRRELARALNFEWQTVVHPSACVHLSAKVGRGTVVFAGAVVQPDAVIGDHVIVNTGATIDHDCVIGDYAHLAPGVHLAGSVHVGEGAFLGIGSVVIPGVKIGRWSTLGAGAVATRDLADGVVAVGVPAVALKRGTPGGEEREEGGQ